MSNVFLFYFGCTVFVLLGQIAVVGTAILIGRHLHRSGFAWLVLLAYLIGAARTIKSLPIFADEELVHLIDAYSSWDNLIAAAGQPVAVWLIAVALMMLYWDLTGR